MTSSLAAAQDDVFPYEYSIDDLPNGLRLITVPTDFPDIVSVHVVVSVGSRHEVEPGKSGFAHFFEHMMFRGTRSMTSGERAAIFKQAGADRNAYTTDDYTNYHTTVSREGLETVLRLEADRFQNLHYEPKAFRTEAMAVLGEYNKNSANPITKLFEVVRDNAFDAHTYKHTTMGFLADIRTMPRQFEYSREFFDRFYRPEYTTIVVVGDTQREDTLPLVQKYWGEWQRGSYRSEIPAEPPQTAPRTCRVEWPAPTQPWVLVAFKGPAFSPEDADMPTLDVLASMAFSPNSELYKKLFVSEQKIDQFFPYFPDHSDPYLLMICARVRDPADWAYVRDEILATCEAMKTARIDENRLESVKSNLRYSFAGSLDSSEAIAEVLAGYVARTRTPESINRVYRRYAAVTPDDVRRVARRYFVPAGRTIATLSHGALPAAPASAPDPAGVVLPSWAPLVGFRILFEAGAADDPVGKEGLAHVTAQLLTNGATEHRSYEEVVETLFPIAAGITAQVDKELTVISGTVHRDNVNMFREVLVEVLREPGFSKRDLERVKANTISFLDVGLRRSDDEELGKEVLYGEIYSGHPYGHHNAGTIESVGKITVDDVRAFYREHYAKPIVGLAGGYPAELPGQTAAALGGSRGETDGEDLFRRARELPKPSEIEANRMTIVQKTTVATGIHIGFPIEVTRSHPDWVALWLVRSYFGEHRSENSHLYQRLRETRGLNYGDYAYIEYFPRGGQQFHPDPNLARPQQIFQVWIRPVPPANGPFALKAAWYELDKLVRDGISAQAFEATRSYLAKFASLLIKSQDRQLGYALDSGYYGTDTFVSLVRGRLAELTVEDVNRVVREHLRSDRLQFVVVTEDAAGFRDAILSPEPTLITYQAKPGPEVLAEDSVIERLRIDLDPSRIEIVPVERVFEK